MFHDLLSDKSTTDLSSGASALLRFVVRDAVQQAVQQIHDKSYSWLYDLSSSMSATSRREWNLSFALCTAVHRVIVIGTPKHHQLYADTASRLIRPFSSVIMHPTAHTITAYISNSLPNRADRSAQILTLRCMYEYRITGHYGPMTLGTQHFRSEASGNTARAKIQKILLV